MSTRGVCPTAASSIRGIGEVVTGEEGHCRRGAASGSHGFGGGGGHRGGVRVPSSLRRSSLLSADSESRMVSPTPNRRLFCSSPAPPTRLLHPTSPTPGRRQALLAQRSCLLTWRRAGVHLCIFSLIGRRFASPFVSVVEKCGRHNCEPEAKQCTRSKR
jgi:hypothetical protein